MPTGTLYFSFVCYCCGSVWSVVIKQYIQLDSKSGATDKHYRGDHRVFCERLSMPTSGATTLGTQYPDLVKYELNEPKFGSNQDNNTFFQCHTGTIEEVLSQMIILLLLFCF